MIEFRNITICRDERVALDRISLRIAPGEHVAVLGPNGSGKSTLIKAITRECYPRLAPDASLRIFGQETWNIFDLRALLGIVNFELMEASSRYSGLEVVLSGFFGSVGVWPNHHVSSEMEKKAHQILERLEIAHLADRCVREMSSGEARRILIGRALVHDPKALVLDEPTTSLDLHAAHSLSRTMRSLAQSGTGIILVTHHLADIIPEIERVILIRRGKVFGDGRKEAVLTAGLLRELFETPVEVIRRDGFYHAW